MHIFLHDKTRLPKKHVIKNWLPEFTEFLLFLSFIYLDNPYIIYQFCINLLNQQLPLKNIFKITCLICFCVLSKNLIIIYARFCKIITNKSIDFIIQLILLLLFCFWVTECVLTLMTNLFYIIHFLLKKSDIFTYMLEKGTIVNEANNFFLFFFIFFLVIILTLRYQTDTKKWNRTMFWIHIFVINLILSN